MTLGSITKQQKEQEGFEVGPSSTRAFVPMRYTTLRAIKGEAFLLVCQHVQLTKTSMTLVPVRGRGRHIDDELEAPATPLLFYLTGTIV